MISTRALRGESDQFIGGLINWPSEISIHALREEGDCRSLQSMQSRHNFNPRPPRGGRPPALKAVMPAAQFQSTPSARRATPIKS